jgi:ABC-type multidrug transport system ATPase subunit
MDEVVGLDGVVALLGRFPALAGADLHVSRGEIVLLRGPNGAGKSTLLRLCAGLLPVAQGSAVVLGHDLRHDRRDVRPRVGLLAHATALYDDLTVADNVRFWARAAGADAQDVDRALGACGLDGRLADLAVHRLSAGQRRRTSLAVLLARRPGAVAARRTPRGLDADGRDLLDGLVRQAAGQGATVLIASHELDRAIPLADRVVHVVAGRVHADAA